MHDVQPFGLVVLVVCLAGLLAVGSNRLSQRLGIPTPLLFLAAAAVASQVVDELARVPHQTVERLVSVALVVILFDGGLHVGRRRLRPALGPVVVVGVLGTFLTAAAVALLAHLAFGFGWWVALLVGTAIAPTDPAVVFSVLGNREIAGRTGTILEGESGANDPVGIALMAGLLSAGSISGSSLAQIGGQFLVQMAVGAVVGVAAGFLLIEFLRRVSLPVEGLYSIGALFIAGLAFGLASVAHGSGFLAVFLAGIIAGDVRAPYKREVERFQSALASLGEIVAFIVLGLTVDLHNLSRSAVLVPGLVLAAVLALVVRPLVVGLCLQPFGLAGNERLFVLWAGLKGAVPILLGSFLLDADAGEISDPQRLYGIVVVVVTFSVLVQGSTVPAMAARLRVPMRTVEPEPWTLGVRLREEPRGVLYLEVAPGSPADGRTVGELSELSEYVWISVVIRDARLLVVNGDTRLEAGDNVVVLATEELRDRVSAAFTAADDPETRTGLQ
ncbi:MAG: cation:proton antiporter [Actinomycetota bacterium]|nr:cation:proton antiporter [Actinomycetota bacterium]